MNAKEDLEDTIEQILCFNFNFLTSSRSRRYFQSEMFMLFQYYEEIDRFYSEPRIIITPKDLYADIDIPLELDFHNCRVDVSFPVARIYNNHKSLIKINLINCLMVEYGRPM